MHVLHLKTMAQADIANIVTDPFLLSILQTSTTVRSASLALLQKKAQESSAETTPDTDLADLRAQKSLLAHVGRLRGQNRNLAHTVRGIKAHTAASKSDVDTLHLSLQNLYYESRHLAGEIAACEDFPHKFMQLPMIPEDEYLARNPEWETKRHGEAEGDGEDALMAARIEKEFQDRTALEEERKRLVAKKAEMMKENARRKEKLAKLDKEMESFVTSAEPIQAMFEEEM